MEKDRAMGFIDTATGAVSSRLALTALALVSAAILSACSHAQRHGAYRDALSPAEHVRLGATYEEQGLRGEAAAQYKAAVSSDPGCAGCWLALGNAEFSGGRFKEAGAAFRKALKAEPHHAGAANNLAMVLLAGNGSLPEAEALAQEALINAGALRPYVLDTLAGIYIKEGRMAAAATLLDMAEAEVPESDGPVREQLKKTRQSIAAAGAPATTGAF